MLAELSGRFHKYGVAFPEAAANEMPRIAPCEGRSSWVATGQTHGKRLYPPTSSTPAVLKKRLVVVSIHGLPAWLLKGNAPSGHL